LIPAKTLAAANIIALAVKIIFFLFIKNGFNVFIAYSDEGFQLRLFSNRAIEKK